MKKRLISLIMAIVMAATLLPWSGIAALAQELEEPSSQQHPCITTNSTGDNLRRPVPNVSLDVTEITRVASTQYSMAKGTTIVKATPSGVPELAPTVSWRDKAYAGETPVATTVTFTFDGFDSQYSDFNPNLLGVPVLTCTNNASVTFTGPVVTGNNYVWTMSSGTAVAGTVLKFNIRCNIQWDNIYTYTRITDSYDISCFSYVENIIFPAGGYVFTTKAKSGSNNDECGDIRYVSRVLGRGVYGSIATDGTATSEINRGYHNFAANGWVNSTDSVTCASWFWSPAREGKAEYHFNGSTANDANRSTATVYLDTSVQTLESINLRMHFFENARPRGSEDEPGQPQQFRSLIVKNSFVNSFDENTTSDSSAISAINPVRVGNTDLTFQYDATYATLFGAGTAGEYTLIPDFYLHDNTTGFFTSSKDNWTRVGTNLKIITTNKATLRSNINTAGVSWVQTVSTRTPVNGTDAAAIGTTGPGKGLIPQSWYYSSGWDDFAGKYENAFNLLVDPKAVQTDIDYGAINLSNSYANLSIKLADSTSDYYGIVYNTTTSLPIDGISGLNTSYYSTNNPYTALKNISFLITAASEGSTYNIYYNGETALTDILQFWPDKKEYYTQETRNALEGALSDAVAVRSMGYNTLYQPTIDRAARNLQAAIENLRFAPLDTTSANVAYSSANIIWSYSPVYNPFTVTDRYAYTSMSGTTYTATLPSGTSVYTYTLASRNAASLAYNAVGAYVLNPLSYDTRDQDTLALKVTALNNALNNLAHGNVISTYWTQTVALIDTIPLASLNSEHRAVVEALLTEGNNIAATGTTDNQARLNVLTDTLFLYLYTEPADFTAIDAAIMNASHRSNKITAVNPVGQGRTTLNYYTAQSRTALQDTIDLAESKRPVFDGEGNPISVELPIIDKSATMSLASSISTATANLSVAGADFYFVNQQVTSGPACNSSHYTAQSWLVYITAYNRVAAALQASGASESTNWQATSTSAQFLATNQAGENGPDALATELFAARNALVHKNTTVTFKLNYGSNETYTTQTGLSGDETVTIPSAPTRTGYVFSGWYSDADCTNLVTLPQPFPLADTVYYAKWVSANYTVTFDGNGNTGGSMTPQSIPFASSAQLKANGFIKAGHLFIGWSTTSDGEVEYTDGTNYTMNSEGTTLYAVWSINSYQIIYIIDEVEYRRVTYQYGAPVTPIADPTKPGHTFSGWPQHPETMPAGDLTIMGSFSKNLYDLVYMIDGEIYKTETYEYDAEITPLPDPERIGSSFSGWSPIPARMPIGGFTVTGTFTENYYNIFFYLEGSLYKKLSYTYNSVIVPPEIPVREGYHFSGWSNLPATMPANPVITDGAYIANTYNAVFMVDGEVYATVPTDYNTSIALPANPEKPGHTFNGWDDVPQLMPAGDVIINATWGTQEYTVTFYIDNVLFTKITGSVGTPVSAPEVNPPTGYRFSGWSIEVPTEIPANNVDIYGSYIANSYTLTFYIEGEMFTTITQDFDSAITAPIPPEVTGKIFAGWSPEVPEKMPAENKVFNGSYDFIDYTASFYVFDELVYSCTFHYGDSMTEPYTPVVPDNYEFMGWSPAIPEIFPADNIRFDAIFELKKLTVLFDLNGGTGTVPAQIAEVIGTQIALPAQGDITREGYNFLGWATTPDATEALESFVIPSQEQTLYAVWQLAELPELIAVEGTDTVVDHERNIIYGFTQGVNDMSIFDYIDNLGNTRIELEYTFNIGTGTEVRLIDNATNEVLKTYYIVIFGDIDGDGRITSLDCSALLNVVSYNADISYDSPYYYAADIDGWSGISSIDASNLLNVVSFNADIDQTTGNVVI